MASEVTADGIILRVPTGDGQHCSRFDIVYSCGHPVLETHCGHIRDKVISIKRNNHSGPCWARRCVLETYTHSMPDKCHRCEMYDLNCEGIRP
ncbi:uncharacterized protein F4812DRAFT_423349 [Daldinia caldariorum]|uniref:uncharacterized protein n=1 Tax=Daldinia caldariorum TaxID=326644 RepID=UPI00200870D5|nr:uncharacterized protein F4812DRAFT_423349 [Daldinia caldariorum]KAI1469499.1 hypothetical protein F4812DRAFT_423349 [Daldinia caldariorum]